MLNNRTSAGVGFLIAGGATGLALLPYTRSVPHLLHDLENPAARP